MMFAKLSKQCSVKRILIVSMTNIGDVVLTCPVIDILCQDFPEAQIDVVVGKKAVSLFEGNPRLHVKVYDKQAPLRKKYTWFLDLYRRKYDVVIDLRHTLLSWLLRPRYATPVLSVSLRALLPVSLRAKRSNLSTIICQGHKKERHLKRLRQAYGEAAFAVGQFAVVTTPEDEHFFKESVAPTLQGKSFVVIAPGAADSAKRWYADGFVVVADSLARDTKIVFVGDDKDTLLIESIQRRMKAPSLSLAGKINLRRLGLILRKSSWVICHDSGVMHLGCYLNVPVLVLWGPTNLGQYAPWGQKSVVVRRNEQCIRCQDPKSPLAHQCMSMIKVEDVLNAIKKIEL